MIKYLVVSKGIFRHSEYYKVVTTYLGNAKFGTKVYTYYNKKWISATEELDLDSLLEFFKMFSVEFEEMSEDEFNILLTMKELVS